MGPRAAHYHVNVVMAHYHWREQVYCREELGNFQVQDVCVEPRGKDRRKERLQVGLQHTYTTLGKQS